MLGSSISFITLRLLFSKRLHAWSSQNQKWQALESVVVNRFFCDTIHRNFTDFELRLRKGYHSSYWFGCHHSLHGSTLIHFLRCAPLLSSIQRRLKKVTVYRGGEVMAVHHCDMLRLSQDSAAYIHWLKNCWAIRRWPAWSNGHPCVSFYFLAYWRIHNVLSGTKILDILFVVGGIIIAVFASWFVDILGILNIGKLIVESGPYITSSRNTSDI